MDKKKFRKLLESEGLAPRTVNFYIESVHAVEKILENGGMETAPRKIGKAEILYLLEYCKEHDFTMQTRKGYFSSLRKYCKIFGSSKVSEWPRIRLPPDRRPNATWLTPDQAKALLSAEMDPKQKVVVHLELCLGLRHVEVIRLRVHDIDDIHGLIRVRGKGPQGDKPRTLPYTFGTAEAIASWAAMRKDLVERSKKRYPISATIPDELIVWERKDILHPYSEEGYGLDKVVCLKLSEQLGFHITNHGLRRTFGRALYHSGVKIETISAIMGHESTQETLKYIGLGLDDMRAALENFRM